MPRRKRKWTQPTPSAEAKKPPTQTPAPADPWPRYLNAKRAAAYLSMGYMTFYRWAQRAIKDGLLHVDKTTKAWTFDKEELDGVWAIRARKVVSIGAAASPADEFITVKQLSERLHVTKATIWDWCRRRHRDPLPHFAISRKVVLFRWSDVVKWIEGRTA